MAKATWLGYIAIGHLGIPIRLYPASQSAKPKFIQIHAADGSPVERIVRCKRDHEELTSHDIIKAVETEPGKYIPLTNRELERVTGNNVKTILVKQFCEPSQINPLFFEKPYYIVPRRGGERAYALIREVFTRHNKAGLAQFVIYNKEQLGALLVDDDILILYQLRFTSEIIPRSSIKSPVLPKPSPQEIAALNAVVDQYTGPVYMNDYRDEYTENINHLIERKAKGLPPQRKPEPIAAHSTPENNIITALKDTLGQPRNTLT